MDIFKSCSCSRQNLPSKCKSKDKLDMHHFSFLIDLWTIGMRDYRDTGTVFQLDSNHCGYGAEEVIESVLINGVSVLSELNLGKM